MINQLELPENQQDIHKEISACQLGLQFVSLTIALYEKFLCQLPDIPEEDLASLFPLSDYDHTLEAMIQNQISPSSSLLDCRDILYPPPFSSEIEIKPEHFQKALTLRFQQGTKWLEQKHSVISASMSSLKERKEKIEAETNAQKEREARLRAEQEAKTLKQQAQHTPPESSAIYPSVEEITYFPPIDIENYYISNGKPINQLKKIKYGKTVKIDVASKGQPPLYVLCTFGSDLPTINSDDLSFNAFDWAVMNAISSIFQSGTDKVTVQQILNVLKGAKGTSRPELKDAIEQSVDKMCFFPISIDYSEQMKRHYGIHGNFLKKSSLILASKDEIAYRNQRMARYNIKEAPILYTYSSDIRQVICVPIAILQTKNVTRTTATVIILREYLIRRIGQAIAGGTHKIKLETIATEIEKDFSKRETKSRYLKQTKDLLDDILAKEIFQEFKGYEVMKTPKSNGIDGIKLLVKKKKA